MDGIYDPNDTFNFEKLVLTKPTIITGGNYFIKFLANDSPLYIQPPKCKLKQGISKSGKRLFADLMFTNENDQFIRWMENLENHSQQKIFNNREQWFDGEMEMADIENYFTSPLKVYKSGKFYIIRTNITTMLGKSVLKIYDENENEVDMDNINENMNIMTILEIQGIKCSARSFQIEIELKQMLVMNPVNIFDKCLLTKKTHEIISNKSSEVEKNGEKTGVMYDSVHGHNNENEDNHIIVNHINSKENEINEHLNENLEKTITPIIEPNTESSLSQSPSQVTISNDETMERPILYQQRFETAPLRGDAVQRVDGNLVEGSSSDKVEIFNGVNVHGYNQFTQENILNDNNDKINNSNKSTNGLEEVEFQLEELPETETIQIKQRNEVYYEMYREARRKAKIARNLALSSYLEAKRIKNTYMLEDLKDSDDSDLDIDDANDEILEKDEKDEKDEKNEK
jgi:hypothetical protein